MRRLPTTSKERWSSLELYQKDQRDTACWQYLAWMNFWGWLKYFSAIVAYSFLRKNAIDTEFINDGQLEIFWCYVEFMLCNKHIVCRERLRFRSRWFYVKNACCQCLIFISLIQNLFFGDLKKQSAKPANCYCIWECQISDVTFYWF